MKKKRRIIRWILVALGLSLARQWIRDYLAGLTDPDRAVAGVTGFNYFDENGDAIKPITLGVFRQRNIISALTQVQPVYNIHRIPQFQEAVRDRRILLFNGRYMYKTNVVYTGVSVNKISDLDFRDLTFELDANLWFRYQGKPPVTDIEFLNAVEPISLGEPLDQQEHEGITSQLYRVRGRFRMDFIQNRHAFGHHFLGFQFRHRSMSQYNPVFVKDVLGIGEAEIAAERMRSANVMGGEPEWRIHPGSGVSGRHGTQFPGKPALPGTSGVIAAIIGFIIKANISNFFSGMVVNQGNAVRTGDWIKVSGHDEGRVEDITWRSTKLRSRDGSLISIPNSAVSESLIHNFSYPDGVSELSVAVRVDPGHSPDHIRKILLDAAIAADGVLENPGPTARFQGIDGDAAVYGVGVSVRDYGRKGAVLESVWDRIWTALRVARVALVPGGGEVESDFRDKSVREVLDAVDILIPFSERAKDALAEKVGRRERKQLSQNLFVRIRRFFGWNDDE